MIKVYTAIGRISALKATALLVLLAIGFTGGAQTIPAYEAEPNNSAVTATAITANPAKVRGYIPVNGDLDYYSFTANAGDRVYAATSTSFSAQGTAGDSYMELISTDGTTVLESDNNDGTFTTNSSTISGFPITVAGTYYIMVRHNSGTTQLRPYDLYLQVQSGAPVAETESNNTPGTANVLPVSGWVNGSSSAADPDYYSINLAAGETVFLSLDLDPERDVTTWNGRLGMGGFGTGLGSILVANDGSATSPNSEAFFMTVKDAGTYYIYVDASAGSGTYQLSASSFAKTGTYTSYPSTAVPVAIPLTVATLTSTITIPDNKLIKDLAVRIDLNHDFMQDLDVTLTSPTGNVIQLFSDIGNGGASGTQAEMNLVLDDYNAVSLTSSTLQRGMGYQPELTCFLDAFKGMNAAGTWTLTIYDDFADDGGTLNNWSLDVMEDDLPTILASYQQISSEDFEASNGGYTHSGSADEWAWGTPNQPAAAGVAAFTTANSGTNCWKTDLTGNYELSSTQTLESPDMDFTAVSSDMYVTWAMKYSMENASFDNLRVTIEEVGGSGLIQNVFTWYGATQSNTLGSPTVNVGFAAGWGNYYADISAFAGKTARFKVTLVSDNSVNFPGVAIDDVRFFQQCGIITLSPALLPDGTAGAAYNQTISQTGGAGVTTFGVTAGALPTGLTMDNAGAITGSPTATGTFNFTVTATDANGCTGDLAYSVTINCPVPTTNLTVTPNPVCNYGSTVTLGGGTPAGGTYSGTGVSGGNFDPTVGTQTITYTYTDAYGCVSSDNDVITVNQPPVVNLGGPYTQCGGTVTLDAGNAGSTYIWSDGTTTTQTLTVNSSNTYSVTVTDGNTCSGSGSTNVTINTPPVVNLGGPYIQCGGTVTLNAGNAGSTYLWNDGITTTQTRTVSSSGTYSVVVTDANTCTGQGSANVTINTPPTVDLGGPYFFCQGNSVTLNAGNAGSTYLWNDNSTNQTLTVSASGTYSVTVTDANTCTGADNVEVTANSLPLVNLGGPYVQCGGNVVLDAGNPGSTYLWNTGSTTKTIIASTTGTNTYSVTVTDGNTCSGSGTASVTINPLPVVDLGGPYTQCQGTVTLDADNAGSSYLWSDNSTNQTLTVSASGDYSVTVTDGNSCSASSIANVTIDLPPLNTTGYTVCQGETVPAGDGFTASGCGDISTSFAGRITLSDPTFNRSQTGTNYSASGIGTATHYTTHTFTVGATGNYTFTMCGDYDTYLHIYQGSFNPVFPATNFLVADDDAALCVGGSEATINLSAGVEYVFVATAFGNNNIGNYTVTFTGAGTVYEGPLNPVLWFAVPTGGALVGTGSPFNPVGTATLPNTNTPGTYTFYVACPNTPYCRTPVDFVINPAPAAINLGGPYTQCGGNVTLDAGSIAPGSTYAWSDGTSAQTIVASTSGTYGVTVTNSFTCTAEGSADVYIQPVPVVNLGPDQAQCGGAVTLDAGTPGSTYLWSDNSTNQTLTVSTTNTYGVTVTDINSGCTASDDVDVTFNTFPVVNLGPNQTQCGGSVTLDAGNAGATYLWSNGVTTQTNTVSTSGIYRVTVTNATNCTATGSVTVTINTYPVLGADKADSVCSGTTLNLNNFYANSGYASYTWNTANPTTVGAGVYQLIVTNAGGCADTAVVTITNRQKPDLGQDVADSVCIGYAYDLWTLYPNNPAYTSYIWNTPTPQEVTAGTYTLIVTNASGCKDTVNAIITTRQQPLLGADAVDSVCVGYSLDLTTYFPDNSYATYTWNTATPDSVGAGVYTLVVSNASGCYDTAQVTITWRQQPVVTFTMNTEMCYTEPAFTLTGGLPMGGTYNVGDSLNVTTFDPIVFGIGTHHITYIFTNTSGCTDSASVDFTVHPQPHITTIAPPDLCTGSAPMDLNNYFSPLGGVYSGFGVSQNFFYPGLTSGNGDTITITYYYTDVNGCMDTSEYPVTVKKDVSVSLISSELDFTICAGDYILFTASGAEFYEFFWNGASQGVATTTDTFSTTSLASHDEVYVIGTNSCSADTSEDIITDVITLPTVDAGPDTTITLGQTVTINTKATGTGMLLYQWSPDYYLNFTNVPNPTYSGPDTTMFIVKVTDTYGCWASDSVTINVVIPDNILLPNIITADGDGKNDIWKLNPKINLDGSDLIIFNRWGETVFEASSYANNWDGTFKATGKKLPDDTYYYVLKVPAQNNHVYKGAINILNSDAK